MELSCAASLWCILDAARDHNDHAETAYRAVLSQGDERSDLFMDLEATPGQLQGVEDVIAADDPATESRRPRLPLPVVATGTTDGLAGTRAKT